MPRQIDLKASGTQALKQLCTIWSARGESGANDLQPAWPPTSPSVIDHVEVFTGITDRFRSVSQD